MNLFGPILVSVAMPIDSDFPPAVKEIAGRPNVFHSRKYVETPLPTFESARSSLPEPVVDDHPEWVKLYWKGWELAFQHLMKPTPGSGFVSNFIDPAFNANTFQWDSCFMLQYAHYAEPTFHAIGTLDNFYAKQHDDGYICREIVRATGEDFVCGSIDDTINPPLFSWVEWQNFLLSGDQSRFQDVLPPLIRYYSWVKAHRRRDNGLYWNTGLGSGEDDLVRSHVAHSWIDMTAQQAQNAYFIARIAEAAGEKEAAAYFDKECSNLGKMVNRQMWDAKSGFYYDLKKDGSVTGIKTVLGFWPLIAHIATKAQAKSLVEHLQNPAEFWRPNVIPALAADEPGYRPDGQYWNGAVWAPTNFVVVKGLQDYGYEDLASQVTAIYLANMATVHDETGTIWENYAPENAAGHGVRDMVGWSADGPVALLIENILGIRTSAASGRIVWRPRLTGRNGIRNLTVGKAHVTLLASPLVDSKRKLTMKSDADIEVVVDSGTGKTTSIRTGVGEKTIEVRAAGPAFR